MENMKPDCKKCLYYDDKRGLCDGYTYKCKCLDSFFCPMYETEEIIERRKKDRIKL